MSNWLDNLVAQRGGLIEEEEDEGECPLPSSPTSDAPSTVPAASAPSAPSAPSAAPAAPAPEYAGRITKEMYSFSSSLSALLKRQESAYCRAMLRTRRNLDKVITKTSLPIQAIGRLGKVSSDAKCKYAAIERTIMDMQPIALT